MKEIRTVIFKSSQGAEDLYWCKETKKIYVRQPTSDKSRVIWLTSNKWNGGYEADCPMRIGITFIAVDSLGNELFRETLEDGLPYYTTTAKKTGDFASEAIKKIANEFEDDLSNHNEWREWLILDKAVFENTDYDDNWLYCLTETVESEIVGTRYFLGKKAIVERQKCRHKISEKEWIEYLVLSEDECVVYEVVGYKLL